jgi:hypothetical protein
VSDAKTMYLDFISDVHTALHLLAVAVLLDAEPEALARAVETVEDEVRYLAITP